MGALKFLVLLMYSSLITTFWSTEISGTSYRFAFDYYLLEHLNFWDFSDIRLWLLLTRALKLLVRLVYSPLITTYWSIETSDTSKIFALDYYLLKCWHFLNIYFEKLVLQLLPCARILRRFRPSLQTLLKAIKEIRHFFFFKIMVQKSCHWDHKKKYKAKTCNSNKIECIRNG